MSLLDLILFLFGTKDSDMHAYSSIHTRDHHRMVTETSKTTNFRANFFFYNTFLYWLANLLIDITFWYWQGFSGG